MICLYVLLDISQKMSCLIGKRSFLVVILIITPILEKQMLSQMWITILLSVVVAVMFMLAVENLVLRKSRRLLLFVTFIWGFLACFSTLTRNERSCTVKPVPSVSSRYDMLPRGRAALPAGRFRGILKHHGATLSLSSQIPVTGKRRRNFQ